MTLIDNGMPVVIVKGADLGVNGTEHPAELEANGGLRSRSRRSAWPPGT